MNLDERVSWKPVLEGKLGEPGRFPEDQELILIMALTLSMLRSPLSNNPMPLENYNTLLVSIM